MSSRFNPHHSLSFPDTDSAASEACISGYINTPAIVQEQDPDLHTQDALGIDQLSAGPLWALPTPEDYSIVYDVIYAISRCYVPGGLSNADLISQMIPCAISSIRNNPFSRDCHYCLTINQLHAYYAQCCDSDNIPLEAASGMTAPTSLVSSYSFSSPSRPQDRVHSLPTTTSEDLECRAIATLIAQFVEQACIHQGGLENTDLVFPMIRWAVTFVADGEFFREFFFRLTIDLLYPHSTSWNDLYHTPLPAATEITTPIPPLSASSPSPQPQETIHSPATASDVSSNRTTQQLACDYCYRTFSRMDSLDRHLAEACTYTKDSPFKVFQSRMRA